MTLPKCEYCDMSNTNTIPVGWVASRMRQERIPRAPLEVGQYASAHFLCSSCDSAMQSLDDHLSSLKEDKA